MLRRQLVEHAPEIIAMKKAMRKQSSLMATIALLLSVACWSAAAETTYTIQRLESLPGGTAIPVAINRHGDVVGRSGSPTGGIRAAVWLENGHVIDVGTLPGGDESWAGGINSKRTVVGFSNGEDRVQAFVWDQSHRLQPLPLSRSLQSSTAFAVNETGAAVGYVSGVSGVRAAIWTSSQLSLLALPKGAISSEAVAINNCGEAVGTAALRDGRTAVRWSADGAVQNLDVIGGDTSSRGRAINDRGEIVGASLQDTEFHAAVWRSGGHVQPLGTLPDDINSEALGINNAGEIVGLSGSHHHDRAFLWSPATGMVDLNDLIPQDAGLYLISAVGINDRGQIIAVATSSRAEAHYSPARFAVLLHPRKPRAVVSGVECPAKTRAAK
jgi:probable HAF family extracellular repeat protein